MFLPKNIKFLLNLDAILAGKLAFTPAWRLTDLNPAIP